MTLSELLHKTCHVLDKLTLKRNGCDPTEGTTVPCKPISLKRNVKQFRDSRVTHIPTHVPSILIPKPLLDPYRRRGCRLVDLSSVTVPADHLTTRRKNTFILTFPEMRTIWTTSRTYPIDFGVGKLTGNPSKLFSDETKSNKEMTRSLFERSRVVPTPTSLFLRV